jgi:F-type H+-transporting ATPase subunit b
MPRLLPVLMFLALLFLGGTISATAQTVEPVAPAIAPPAQTPDAAVPLEPDHAAAEHGDAEEHGGGMPQLDIRTFPSQIVWLFISFALLYYLLSRKALPRVSDILETRQERIAADLDRAARSRSDAEEALGKYEQLLAQAQARAAEEIKGAHERLSADIAGRQAALDRDLAKRLADAERRINEAREGALTQIAGVAAEAAQAAVDRLAGIKVSSADARRAVDSAMGDAMGGAR